jgi:hypothetical protein
VIKFNHKDALVLTKLEFPINDGDSLTGAEHEMAAMGVAVRALILIHVHGPDREIVMCVVLVSRGNFL